MSLSNTNTLLSVTGQTGALSGGWFNTRPTYGADSEFIPVQANITAGTATVVIEGRNSPNDTPFQLTSFTTTDGARVSRFPQMRVRLSAATGATVSVSTGESVRG